MIESDRMQMFICFRTFLTPVTKSIATNTLNVSAVQVPLKVGLIQDGQTTFDFN